MEEGQHEGGGTGRTGMMRRRRRLLRRPRQRTWKTSGVTERKGGRGNRAAVRALTPGMVPVPTAARKRGAPSTRTDRFTGGGRKFLPTPCTCNSSCSDASSGCYSSGSSFVNVTAQRSVPGVPSGVSPGGRLACRFSSRERLAQSKFPVERRRSSFKKSCQKITNSFCGGVTLERRPPEPSQCGAAIVGAQTPTQFRFDIQGARRLTLLSCRAGRNRTQGTRTEVWGATAAS